MNPFTAVIDWIDENGDFGAPIGAFIGVGIAITLCFIFGAQTLCQSNQIDAEHTSKTGEQ